MPGFVKELGKSGFTALTGVNTLFNGLLNTPGFAELDFSTLHLTLGGGMAVQRKVAERWKQTTGCTLAEAYGLTETSPARSEEHTSELQSLMRTSYAVFCLKKKKTK